MIHRKDAEIVEKIQFFIPYLVDSLDSEALEKESAKLIGRRMNYVKYFIEDPTLNLTHIPMIVTEDFTIYDLSIDFEQNTLSFYLEGGKELAKDEVLSKIFQLFLVKFSTKKIGFFTYSKGREGRKYKVVK